MLCALPRLLRCARKSGAWRRRAARPGSGVSRAARCVDRRQPRRSASIRGKTGAAPSSVASPSLSVRTRAAHGAMAPPDRSRGPGLSPTGRSAAVKVTHPAHTRKPGWRSRRAAASRSFRRRHRHDSRTPTPAQIESLQPADPPGPVTGRRRLPRGGRRARRYRRAARRGAGAGSDDHAVDREGSLFRPASRPRTEGCTSATASPRTGTRGGTSAAVTAPAATYPGFGASAVTAYKSLLVGRAPGREKHCPGIAS